MQIETLDSQMNECVMAIGLLIRRIRSASSAHDLSWTQRAVMSRLAHDGAATIADLARAESVKPQSMGTIVATLEKLGFVERHPHPTDGRQVHIALSCQGAAFREKSRAAKLTWLLEAVEALDDDERRTLFAAGEIIKRLAES